MEIHPLKIYLSETMYRMMWDYFFPEEDDSQRRQVSQKSCSLTFPTSCLRPLIISDILLLGERKFGGFQHQREPEELEEYLLVLMLLLLLAIL